MASPQTLTRDQDQDVSRRLHEMWHSGNPNLEKQAADLLTDYTRTRMREECFMDNVWEPTPVANSDLIPQLDSEKLVTYHEIENYTSPAAISVPFNSLTTNFYMRANRYPVQYERIMSRRFRKDVDELRTYRMDLRQLFSDNAVFDMHQEKDRKFVLALNTAAGPAGTVMKTAGSVMHKVISGGMTRESVVDSKNVLRQSISNLEPRLAITNHITIQELTKWGHNEWGGPGSEDVMAKGWTMAEWAGIRWVVTIKRDLVPFGRVHYLPEPKFIGKHGIVEEIALYVKKEWMFVEFAAMGLMGATIANCNSSAVVDFV